MAQQSKAVADLLSAIDGAVEKFNNASPVIEDKLMKRFHVLLKDLDLDRFGHVKPTVKNLRKVNRIARELKSEILNSSWGGNVLQLEKDISEIQALQVKYFSTIEKSYKATAFMNEVTADTIRLVQYSLLGDGLDANVVHKIGVLLRKNITESVSFSDLVQSMSDFLTGTSERVGVLQRYSSQLVNDSLNQYAAQLNKAFTDDLGLKWFMYVGSLVKDSRPWCVHMVSKQYIHESELTALTNGNIDGKKVSLQGLIVGTNAQNVQVNRGGYNCNHLMLPISDAAVPKKLRDRFN